MASSERKPEAIEGTGEIGGATHTDFVILEPSGLLLIKWNFLKFYLYAHPPEIFFNKISSC